MVCGLPARMMLVARMLVNVVPRVLHISPPTNGVHVLFKLYAENNKLNSVLDAPSSLESLLFKGPKIYEALRDLVEFQALKENRRRTNGCQLIKSRRRVMPRI